MQKTHGQIGYEAYAVSTGGKTFDGRTMPRWDELPPNVVKAWEDAATAIRTCDEPLPTTLRNA